MALFGFSYCILQFYLSYILGVAVSAQTNICTMMCEVSFILFFKKRNRYRVSLELD